MIPISFISAAVALAHFSAHQESSDGLLPATELRPAQASENFKSFEARGEARVVLGRVIYEGSYWCSADGNESAAILDLDERYSTLSFKIGGTGSVYKDQVGEYSVVGDGRVIASGETHTTDPTSDAWVDVSSVKKLTIRLSGSACMLNPLLSRSPRKRPLDLVSVAPKNGTTVRELSPSLSWVEVPGATRYSVVLVAESAPLSAASPRSWVITSESNTASVAQTAPMSGWYNWSVWAYGTRGPIAAQDERRSGRFYIPREAALLSGPELPMEGKPLSIDRWWFTWDQGNRGPGNSEFSKRCGYSKAYYVELPSGSVAYEAELKPGSHSLKWLVDGVQVAEAVTPPSGSPPKKLRLSIKGPAVLTIIPSGYFGYQVSLDDVLTSSFLLEGRPTLTLPIEDTLVDSLPLWLNWKSVEGAKQYGVRVDLLRADASQSLPREPTRVFTTTGQEAQLSLAMNGQPPGWYQWRVIAFGAEGTLGTWSSPKRFRWNPRN